MENFFKKNIYISKSLCYTTETNTILYINYISIKRGGRRGEGGNFPSSPVVKNSPCNAEVLGSIPGWGTKTPHASEPLGPPAAMTEAGVLRSPCATTRESVHWQRKVPRGAMEILQAATKI